MSGDERERPGFGSFVRKKETDRTRRVLGTRGRNGIPGRGRIRQRNLRTRSHGNSGSLRGFEDRVRRRDVQSRPFASFAHRFFLIGYRDGAVFPGRLFRNARRKQPRLDERRMRSQEVLRDEIHRFRLGRILGHGNRLFGRILRRGKRRQARGFERERRIWNVRQRHRNGRNRGHLLKRNAIQ